jgi:hypothetical protein
MGMKAKTIARPSQTNYVLLATIFVLGLSPIALGVSLGLALFFHLAH